MKNKRSARLGMATFRFISVNLRARRTECDGYLPKTEKRQLNLVCLRLTE